MCNLQEYGLWLVLVIMNAVIVSKWINYLILMSGETAGLAAGLFLSIFLASLMFFLARSLVSHFDRQQSKGRSEVTESGKVVGVA